MSIDFKSRSRQAQRGHDGGFVQPVGHQLEQDDSLADKEHPFGPGPVLPLENSLKWLERDGYETRNVDNYAGAFYLWSGRGRGGHLCPLGRGASREADGRPTLQTANHRWQALCTWGFGWGSHPWLVLRSENHQGSGTASFQAGSLWWARMRESGWADMDYYFAHVGLQNLILDFPRCGISIINGEKGNITEYLHFDGANDGDFVPTVCQHGLRKIWSLKQVGSLFRPGRTLAGLQEKIGGLCC